MTIKLPDLCQTFAINRTTLNDLFYLYTGESTINYLNKYRMDQLRKYERERLRLDNSFYKFNYNKRKNIVVNINNLLFCSYLFI